MQSEREILTGLDKELCQRLMTLHNSMLEAMSQGGNHTITVDPQIAADVMEAVISITHARFNQRTPR